MPGTSLQHMIVDILQSFEDMQCKLGGGNYIGRVWGETLTTCVLCVSNPS
jgi:hypothetical protein